MGRRIDRLKQWLRPSPAEGAGGSPRPRFRRRLAINLLVGILSWGLATLLGDTPWLRALEDQALGLVMDLYRGSGQDTASGLAAIAIDTPTYRRWGEPPVTPRAELLALIQAAERMGAAAIVVDVELRNPEHGPGQPLSPGDRALLDWLNARADAPDRPPVILIRPLRHALDSQGQPLTDRPLLALRTFLEDAGLRPSDQLIWGSAMLDRAVGGPTRYWRLVELACTETAAGPRWSVLASAALLAAVVQGRVDLETPGAGAAAARQLVEDLRLRLLPHLRKRDCAAQSDWPYRERMLPLEGLWVTLGPEHGMSLGSDDLARRIVYRIPAPPAAYGVRPYLPGDPILDPSRGGDIDPGLRGRILLIGNIHDGAGDLHQTPLGPMPGLYVLANAVQTLSREGHLKPLPEWAQLPLMALLIAGISLAFLHLDSFWAKALCTVGTIVLLAPLSVVLFRYGIWLNLAIPLLAVQLTETVAELREAHPPSRTRTH